MSSQRILLVSPIFHGYWHAIQTSLESLGYSVTTHCYDSPQDFFPRIRNKLMHDLPLANQWQSASNSIGIDAIKVLREISPDIVLTIKGDHLGPVWWEELDRLKIPRVTWLYDEIRRTRYTRELLSGIGPVASYSPLDVAELNTWGVTSDYVPLAFDHRAAPIKTSSTSVSFIGARYQPRVDLLQSLQASGVPVEVYGKSWSRKPLDVIRTRQWSPTGIPAHPDLSREHAYGVMSGSPATVNIHGDQDGFTMRTFEACGVGALQLIDRPDASEFYEVGTEVVVFESPEELAATALRAFSDVTWSQGIREAARRRTLAQHTFDHRMKQLEALWV